MMNTRALCLKSGILCWRVHIDAVVCVLYIMRVERFAELCLSFRSPNSVEICSIRLFLRVVLLFPILGEVLIVISSLSRDIGFSRFLGKVDENL